MRRPIWLLSMDTDRFCAPPMTTGALAAYFLRHGRSAARSEVELVHFLAEGEARRWLGDGWRMGVGPRAHAALAAGLQPVFGLSCYTWNVAELLEIARTVKQEIPAALIVAGGPHVQRAEDFLGSEAIDAVVLGEGEVTFTALVDCARRDEWRDVAGLAFLADDGSVLRTAPRPSAAELDLFPSPLDVIELRDAGGRPRYRQVAYETSRGCPYRCAFCEWGTGAIGTKIVQHSLERIRSDLERLVAGGVQDIWLCDSNFGALREDRAKAEIICELKRRTGLPQTFATSWSKNHNRRVQEIVRLLHRHGLLWHYHLALQTLTPEALELSHRTNMRANDYEVVVRALAEEGVPVAAELIWGLPGDDLPSFERNLDHLMTVFPAINIFGYTLLPGTEFFERRDELRIEALPVAGYGKARGEYVVGCHSFRRDDGEEGYFLIAAYVMLARGHVVPLLVRWLALTRRVEVSRLLRATLRALVAEAAAELEPELGVDLRRSRIAVYESRDALYLHCLARPERTFATIERAVVAWLAREGAADLVDGARRILELDRAFCPRTGPAVRVLYELGFEARRVLECLGRMELPPAAVLEPGAPVVLEIDHPGRVGEVLLDPDGGSWMRGLVVAPESPAADRDLASRDATACPAP